MAVQLQTLVVMRASRLREILLALLGSMRDVALLPPANDAGAALARLAAESPDVVWLDWDLPGESAFGLLRRIKLDHPAVRCVALVTSYPSELQARSAQADAVLFRGFSVNDCLAVISYFLREPPPGPGPG